MKFTVKALKGGKVEIQGLEEWLQKRLSAVRKWMKAPGKAGKEGPGTGSDTLDALLLALKKHPRKEALIKAGSQRDQLLRSLIPLYLARELDVNSGTISRFWKVHGVRYASPNAAKALREHVGYARSSKKGKRITPNGIKYVEAALSAKKAA